MSSFLCTEHKVLDTCLFCNNIILPIMLYFKTSLVPAACRNECAELFINQVEQTDPEQCQAKSSQLYLGRVVLFTIGWYQKGSCVNYEYMIKI